MTGNVVEISVAGNRVAVPALDVDGKHVIVRGGWLRVAAIHDEEWYEGEHDLEACVSALKAQQSNLLKADIFSFAQKLPDVTPRYPYPVEWQGVAVARANDYEAWWTQLSRDGRNDVRKSVKRGVVTRRAEFDDDLVRGIVEIYNESPTRQGKPFWHFQKGFDTVKRENATFQEKSTFIGAYYNDELIGFLKMVHLGPVAAMMQFLTKIRHRDKRPSNALIAKAVEHCATTGMAFLTYGTYRGRSKRVSSLTRFKHRMGFEEIFVPRFHVPLTTKGRMCLALGLHRDLRGRLPESVAGLLYHVRDWHRQNLDTRPQCDEELSAG